MKFFIKRILVFIFLVVGIIAVDLGLQYTLLFRDENLKLPKETINLIVGHSHSAYAYNPKYIAKTVNLSEAGEPYIYTYFKTKRVIENNPQIQTVFIEYTNNQIRSDMNKWLWDDVFLQEWVGKYGVLLDYDALKLLYSKNPTGFTNAVSKSLFDNVKRVLFFHENTISKGCVGAYLPSEKVITKAELSKIKKNKPLTQISECNILYLQKLIKYCNDRNIDVCLVRSPLHKIHNVSTTESKYFEILKTWLKGAEYIDNKDFTLPDNGFLDSEHLNSYGAKLYSQHFEKQLKSKAYLSSQ